MTSVARIGVRLFALVAAVALLVLGSPSSASAQCVAPTYNGGLPVRAGSCPEELPEVRRGWRGRWSSSPSGSGWSVRCPGRGLPLTPNSA